jgi:hypothetical protein
MRSGLFVVSILAAALAARDVTEDPAKLLELRTWGVLHHPSTATFKLRDGFDETPRVPRAAQQISCLLVDLVLIRDRLVKVGILLPSPDDVAEVAMTDGGFAQANSPGQGLDGDRVEALAFCLRAPA